MEHLELSQNLVPPFNDNNFNTMIYDTFKIRILQEYISISLQKIHVYEKSVYLRNLS